MITKLYSDRQRMHGQIAWRLCLAVLIMTLTLSGGGGSGTGDVSDTGEVIVALTDAEGDFASYTVDVLSLTLTKANGAVVETLPLSTRVDFARYTDLTEFLTAATLPSGVYVKGTMVLDYSAADIWVEDAGGEAVKVDTIIDSNGNPVTQLEVSVQLEDRKQLTIVPGVPAHLTLDFDLQASNSVAFDPAGVPSVPGGDVDVVRGSVVARAGNSLRVKGVTLFRRDGTIIFNDTVTVELADSTRVSKQLSMEPAAIGDVSVGQRVTVFGTVNNRDVTALVLDAASGYLRMELSSLQGTRVDLVGFPEQTLPLVVNVTSINGRNAGLYDFTGTGSDTASDADPFNYEVNTGALDVAAIAGDAPLAVRGHVTPFGQAPLDFDAQTIVDRNAISP